MSSTKILLVDDDTSLLRVMEHHLIEAGFHVKTAGNGREGLEKQKEDPSSVIFTDLKMPEMDGIDFINSLHEFDTYASVVVITGFLFLSTSMQQTGRRSARCRIQNRYPPHAQPALW